MLFICFYYFLFFYLYWKNRNIQDYNIRSIRYICIEAFIILFIFFGFRNITVLCDTPHYYSSLRDKMDFVDSIPWYYFNLLERFEPGYQLYETLHAKIFSNPYSIIISSSLLITIGNILLFKKHNRAGLFLCLFLLMNYQMPCQYAAIRQGIATIILYYAIDNLMQRNYKKYVIASLLAATFHVTAIIVLGLYPIKDIRLNKKSIILFIVALIVVTKFLITPLTGFFDPNGVYSDTNADRDSFPIGSFILFSMMTYLFVSARKFYTKYNNVVINEMMWLLGGLCLFFQALDIVFPIIGRISMYFAPFLISLYVSCLRSVSTMQIRQKYTLLTFCIFFGWFVLYNSLKPEWYYLYPYSFMNIEQIFTGYEIDR